MQNLVLEFMNKCCYEINAKLLITHSSKTMANTGVNPEAFRRKAY